MSAGLSRFSASAPRPWPALGPWLLGLAVCWVPGGEARADVASWMFVGSGWSRIESLGAGDSTQVGSLLVDAGFGSSPRGAWVVGGVLHAAGHFGFGTDLGGALRITSGGYSRGDWGLGLDVGPQYRFGDRAGPAAAARVLLGGPWGLAVSAGATYGPEEVATFTVALGIDFARLTVHRTSGLDWFPNPHPSPRLEEGAFPHQAAVR